MNFQAKVIQDRIAQRKAIQDSDISDGLKEGIDRRLAARANADNLRVRKMEAASGMRKNSYSAGEQFDSARHQSVDGEPTLNKDGSFRLKPGQKKH